MEVRNLACPCHFKVFSKTPTQKFLTVAGKRYKVPLIWNLARGRLYTGNLISACSHIPSTRKLQTWAHLGRTSNRRNSLRKKLLHDQVRLNPLPSDQASEFQNPFSGFSDNGSLIVNFKDKAQEESDSVNGIPVENANVVEEVTLESYKTKIIGGSDFLTKLENWVDQYKRDNEYWGIGSGFIFTVYQDSEGNVRRVLVDEDEICERRRARQREFEDLADMNSKILRAKRLAQEMESGNNVIPRNSSVTKFVAEGKRTDLIKAIQYLSLQHNMFPKLRRIGNGVICVCVVLFLVKKFFAFGGNEDLNYTEAEKEMLRRKITSRREKEMLEIGNVETIIKPLESPTFLGEKPKLDKERLMDTIVKARVASDGAPLTEASSKVRGSTLDMNEKLEKIRNMARQARESEGRENAPIKRDEEMQNLEIEKSAIQFELHEKYQVKGGNYNKISGEDTKNRNDIEAIRDMTVLDDKERVNTGFLNQVSFAAENNICASADDNKSKEAEVNCKKITSNLVKVGANNELSIIVNGNSCKTERSSIKKKEVIIRPVNEAVTELTFSDNKGSIDTGIKNKLSLPHENDVQAFFSAGDRRIDKEVTCDKITLNLVEIGQSNGSSNIFSGKPCKTERSSIIRKAKIIRSVSEARDYLLEKHDRNDRNKELPIETEETNTGSGSQKEKRRSYIKRVSDVSTLSPVSTSLNGLFDKLPSDTNPVVSASTNLGETSVFDSATRTHENCSQNDLRTYLSNNTNVSGTKPELPVKAENWVEKNFHEVEPIIQKIGAGFRDNYMRARNEVKEQHDVDMSILQPCVDNGEHDWMRDTRLRNIVFQVRENELAGREPFYMMNNEDQQTFFKGLEKHVEKENQKLANLHEWLHANIENLDYGADGISVYDPPEKIIPRWKGPPVDKIPEFMANFLERKETNIASGSFGINPGKGKGFGQHPRKSFSWKDAGSSLPIPDPKKTNDEKLKKSKIVIEGSDGSVKAGKKSGKEYWQHTKKWSREFLDVYNAQTDPEVKTSMKDIGKDLDRWITEKEIKEAADLMNNLPYRNNKFVQQKLNKVKREMQLFGPQAVVSKYKEYADEEEEDYLWWLDLPYVLCIELYTKEEDEDRVGFYSLEMAADLDLEPKPYHVIAFEDAGECKNLCLIIQSHMNMLGNGHAFVVAQPPKDVFRMAKANGFSVTVIRKGELKFNVDQILEEAEEQITEIGSKMYHDKIMRERSVDMSALMKGVFGLRRPFKSQKAKRKWKKPGKK